MSESHVLAGLAFLLAVGAAMAGWGVRRDLQKGPPSTRETIRRRGLHWLWLVPFVACMAAVALILLYG